MKQFNMNRAINHRQYVIYWYKSNKVRLNIQKYINLLKKIVCTPYIFAAILSQLNWKSWWELKRLLSIDWWWEIQVMILIFQFWATFGGKMGVASTRTLTLHACPPRLRLMAWGLNTRPKWKSWPTRWNFWVNHYFEIMFLKFLEVNLLTPLIINLTL